LIFLILSSSQCVFSGLICSIVISWMSEICNYFSTPRELSSHITPKIHIASWSCNVTMGFPKRLCPLFSSWKEIEHLICSIFTGISNCFRIKKEFTKLCIFIDPKSGVILHFKALNYFINTKSWRFPESALRTWLIISSILYSYLLRA
jgi:hypothetical protein